MSGRSCGYAAWTHVVPGTLILNWSPEKTLPAYASQYFSAPISVAKLLLAYSLW
jgi:hypothetical protein